MNEEYTIPPVAVLGSTGSVGRQTLDVCHRFGVRVDALTGGKNTAELEKQIRRFKPRVCAMADADAARDLAARVRDMRTKVYAGADGILRVIDETDAKTAVNSILGLAGLAPTLAAASRGMRIATANKESIVAAGNLVDAAVKAGGAELIPVDSEHSAIFQCLHCGTHGEVKRLLLTASGGPFFGYTKEQLADVTLADALKHPTWKMGAKITVDSASLMNKGLEVIEAVRLFGVSPAQVTVVVHRESIIHSAVEYIDNAVIAELSHPDMRECVQYALTYPARLPAVIEPLDLFSVGTLTFKHPDTETFPLLALAYRAIGEGGLMPAVLSAANEAAVSLFLDGKIRFCEIAERVAAAMDGFTNKPDFTVEDVFSADRDARARVLAAKGVQ
ncbi:MAG: 1-deoxy-D-xylulose-5-phosphate reductoisomerase [Oscillospiraceae bacterium]|nr:MAG: 1-deoxy-D-xylulose-5-phosphate reductoisomerase [Oscillospiraceae bacterium]